MEFKGLREDYVKKIEPFFTSPLYQKFLTEFTIGNNKLKFYGLPLTMMQNSKLIETVISKNPPYELLTFGAVYEKPMTLLWIAINELIAPSQNDDFYWLFEVLEAGNLSLEEYLQLGRLINYFDLDETNSFGSMYSGEISMMLNKSTSEDKKVIEAHKTQVLKLINDFIEHFEPGPIDDLGIRDIFTVLLNRTPELLDELKLLPIYDEDNKFVGFFEEGHVYTPDRYEIVGKEGRIIRVKTVNDQPTGSGNVSAGTIL